MTNYITDEDVRNSIDVSDVSQSTLDLTLAAVTSWIDGQCGQNFGLTTSAARYYDPTDAYCVAIDSANTVTAVATDDGIDGTYSTSWATTDWQAQPVGGISPSGRTGWPYRAIVAVSGRTFYKGYNRRPIVKVTGTWGWAAVPADIKLAALMVVEETYKAVREAPFGSSNLADFGPVTIRGNRRVQELLAPYKLVTSSDGRFLVA